MRVLIGCESSGVVRDAFLARGHEVLSADLEPTERPGPHYRGDLFDVIDFPWDLAIIHIPCTDSSTSGARWFKDKKQDGRFYASNALWMNAWRRAGHIPKVVFEHPVSVISSLFRKPDQIIQPHQFWHLDEPGKGEAQYRPLCLKCDVALNALVLRWMRDPLAEKKIEAYRQKVEA